MSGPRYDLVPKIGAARKNAATEPKTTIKRSSGYGWAALAIATLVLSFAAPAIFVVLIWLVAGVKRLMRTLD